jgi:alkylation response protein AidB-like acyl-CoA dehydrogenase
VDFAFDAEQLELRQSVRRFLAEKSSEADVRLLMASDEGYDPAVWRQMADQLGLQAMAIPEQYGGFGFSMVELAMVFEEMGAALLCAPFFSSIGLAAAALLASDDEDAKAQLLPGVAAGITRATLAVALGREPQALSASHDGSGWQVSGTAPMVLDGHLADLVLVEVSESGGSSLFAIDGGASGLERRLLGTLDETRKVARLEFEGVEARLVGEAGAAGPALRRALDGAAICLAAEQLGGAQHVLDLSVDYAKSRHQFGRPIGSFQAIKHLCADVLVDVESARSAVYYAAWAMANSADEATVVASLAKAFCSDAYVYAAQQAVQVHGGIGFTWEHPVHLYLKRAVSSRALLGDPTFHRELLAQQIGL